MPKWLLIILFVLGQSWLAILLGIKFYKDRYGKEKSVQAQVVEKHISRYKKFSKYGSQPVTTDYSAIFLADGKKISFFVRPWQYDALEKGETGTLTYKGNQFMRFK